MRFPVLLAGLIIAAATSLPTNAAIIQYSAQLDGPSEDPANASPGIGTALVSIDTLANTLRVEASFMDLIGLTTNVHIHCCTAAPGAGNTGVATTTPTFPGFPSGVISGSYDATFDLHQDASFNASFITSNGGNALSARDALLLGLDQGRAYFNIHSTAFPSGEIRGFLQAVPEPGSLALILMGIGLLGLRVQLNHNRLGMIQPSYFQTPPPVTDAFIKLHD